VLEAWDLLLFPEEFRISVFITQTNFEYAIIAGSIKPVAEIRPS